MISNNSEKDNTSEKNILEIIDKMFDENRLEEVEKFMLDERQLAHNEKRYNDELLMLNELLGYYRQKSDKDNILDIIKDAIELMSEMQMEGSLSYATTISNAANALRSIGELEKSREYYMLVEKIYNEKQVACEIEANDMRIAGLYNNLSLLYQELSDYNMAEKYQLKSLAIVTNNEAGFEIAVAHANLANTYLLACDYDKSIEYAKKAIDLFEERGLKDPHYCAALSALGNCYVMKGNYAEAKAIFEEAAKIVLDTFGKNIQYERLMDNLKYCETMVADDIKNIKSNINETEQSTVVGLSGIELSKRFYEEYGRSMIAEKFPEYENRIAVGLAGEGSECFGFDDAKSRDHDYGPSFCMWVTNETYDLIGEELQAEYDKLPKVYCGIELKETPTGANRRGVLKIDEFFSRFLIKDSSNNIDYQNTPDYALAACSNGVVFRDDEGIFSQVWNSLKEGYPKNVQYLKIAEEAALFSQCGQYNYSRMKERGDDISARIMLSDFVKHALKLYHYILNVYPPHDKWLTKSVSLLGAEGEGYEIISKINEILNINNPEKSIEELADFFVHMMYANGFVSDMDTYLANHVDELLFKSQAVLFNKKDLVRKIARLEFEAFDKVQNEGGRASCQNDWPTFSVMRKSQYLTWDFDMLLQYYYDFNREYSKGHNLITEKYGRMMESTAPERYEELKAYFPVLSDEKKAIIEQIVKIQMQMVEDFASEHPKVASNARDLHTSEDNMFNTSYETYLRGEISTYSDKMLQLYGQFVVAKAMNGENIAYLTIENTAKLYGYEDIEAFEKDA